MYMKMENEIWVDIIGYEGRYQISNLGRVKGLESLVLCKSGSFRELPERILKSHSHHNYRGTHLRGENGRSFLNHRLIAVAFIPNPENKPDVNHKNGIRYDNRIENLEWCTKSENSQHAYDTGLSKVTQKMRDTFRKKASKKVIDTKTGIIYESAKVVADLFGYHEQYFRNKLKGHKKNETSFQYYQPEK